MHIRKLSDQEFEQALKIRIKVFVEEQNVPLEEEHDEYDQQAEHFGIFSGKTMIGTGRLLKQDQTAKIGRIAILEEFRGVGLGSKLIRAMLSAAKTAGSKECVVDAQIQALPFYTGLGFKAEGDNFLDGGIPHLKMRLQF